MHIGPHLPAALPGARRTLRPLAVCHVMADIPGLAETFVGHEIRALTTLGHRVVPVVLALHGPGTRETALPDDAAHPQARPLGMPPVRLDEVDTLAALTGAAANPAGFAIAVAFAQRQRGVPRRVLLRAAARLAHVARAHGCTHLHAHFAQSAAATTVICAARMAGLTASLTAHAADMASTAAGETADLALKLGAADLIVAVTEDIADEVRRLAPHAAIRTIPAGVAPDRFRPGPGPGNGRLQAALLADAFADLQR